MNRLRRLVPVAVRVSMCAIWAAAFTSSAQFKVVGPPPVTPVVAHQQIKTLLEKVDPNNSAQTIQTLTGLLAWYRDIVDDELIAAWKKNPGANLSEALESLADSRVATEVVTSSWREQRPAAFNLANAPMLGHLMARFPESAQPFLDDLLGSGGLPMPDLSPPEAEAVCRILLDMPEIGTWRRTALQVLPHYRRAAESLLTQDLHGSDRERSFQAQRWLADLKSDVPETTNDQPKFRRRPGTAISPSSPSGVNNRAPVSDRASSENSTAPAIWPPPEADRATAVATGNSRPAVTLPAQAPVTAAPLVPSVQPAAPAQSYQGARSGTLESTGGPIPQNAEYVFRNLPAVKIQLDYDTKIWDARLVPGEGQTQRLILKNKGSGPQKRCVVHWSVIP